MLRRLLRRLRVLWLWNRKVDELDEEIRFHLAAEVDEQLGRGLSHEQALSAAKRDFGNLVRVREETRETWGWGCVERVVQDLRYTLRSLAKAPGFTTVAVLTLALGIGANTAVFSIVSSLLLRSLPVSEPERLVAVSASTPISQGRTAAWSYAVWIEIQERADAFDGALAWSIPQLFNLAQGGEVDHVAGIYTSGEFFDALGVVAHRGRLFVAADDMRGGGRVGPVAVLSYRFWQRRFGGDPSIVGQPLLVEGVPFTIVGVTSSTFFGAEVGHTFDVALPLGTEPLIRGTSTLLDRRNSWIRISLRLRRGQSTEAATTELRRLQAQIREAAMPPNLSSQDQQDFLNEPFRLVSLSSSSALRHTFERPLLILFAISALVLLIACGNVANLLLVRGAARRGELTVRLALGASRWRLARQRLMESLTLALAGAAAGLVLAQTASRLLVSQLPTYFDRVFLDVSLDWRVVAFAVAVAVATAGVFGVVPAWITWRVAPVTLMKRAGRTTPERNGSQLSSAFVVTQLSLSLVLVVAAGLFIQTFEGLSNRDMGFERDRVLVVYADASATGVDPGGLLAFYTRLVETVRAVPGVSQASLSMTTPISGLSNSTVVDTPNGLSGREIDRTVFMNYVAPNWFETYGIALQAGRDLTVGDTAESLAVLVVNAAFVRRFLPDGAIGQVVFDPRRDTRVRQTIVGVVANTVYRSVREDPQPTMYAPLTQLGFVPPFISMSVRSSAVTPAALQRDIAAALSVVDGDLSFRFASLRGEIEASLTQERMVALLAGSFGALAVLLAAVGLYGTTSYAVARRQKELAIRTALGATPSRTIQYMLGRVVMLLAIGTALGAGGSLWLSRFAAPLLFGLQPTDVSTLIGAVFVLGGATVVAALFPARRAVRSDPNVALREG